MDGWMAASSLPYRPFVSSLPPSLPLAGQILFCLVDSYPAIDQAVVTTQWEVAEVSQPGRKGRGGTAKAVHVVTHTHTRIHGSMLDVSAADGQAG